MRKRQQGVTLIELMVGLAVLAIVVSLGVPAFTDLIRNSRMTSFVNATVATARIARAEAVRRNRAVTFCPSADRSSCSAPDTALAYIVFEDNGTPKVRDAADEILLVQDFPSDAVNAGFPSASEVRFRQTGQVDGFSDTTIVFCDARGANHARTLKLMITGRVQNLGHRGDEACS